MSKEKEEKAMTDILSFLEKLAYSEEGEEDSIYMKPCLDITLYWCGSLFDRSDDILKFYQQCLEVLGGSLRYFSTETMTEFRPLKKDTLDLLPFWLRGTKSRRDIYMLFLESGLSPDRPSDRAFALNAIPDKGYMRLILPTSFISGSAVPYVDLARNIGQMVSCDFGHGGFAINWDHPGNDQRGVLRVMNSIAHRYPGLDMSYPFSTKYIACKGIKCVNWLTFLNTDYCDRLGGLPALRERLDKNVMIHDAKNGVMIQAGAVPEIGDVNRQEHLPIYHEVGKALAPIRCREHPPLFGPRGFADKEATERWLSRFDS
jgi:hypothetical protein